MKRLLAVVLLLLVRAPAQEYTRMLSGVNYQTGTSYTFVATDATKLVSFNNASAVSATLPAGSNAGFGINALFSVQNLGSGTVTISCSGCTINGTGNIQLAQNQSADIYGDGSNYAAQILSPTAILSTGITNILSYGLQSGDSASTVSCTSSSGSPTLTCGALADFAVNNWILMPSAGAVCGTAANTTCTAPAFTVTPEGTTGATTYNYKVATMDAMLGIGVASSAVTINNGNATLSNSNFNYISVSSPTNLIATYLLWCSVGAGAYNYIGSFSPSVTNSNGPAYFFDTSCGAVTPPLGVPNTPPTVAQNEALSAKITASVGTTLTVSVNAGNNVTSGTVVHDDAPMIQTGINTVQANGGQVLLPPLTYIVNSPIIVPCTAARVRISGEGASLDGQYDGSILRTCNLAGAQRPEDITVSGLRINGAANGLLSGSAARIAKEASFGGQIGEEIDTALVSRHYGTSIYNTPGAAYVVGKGVSGIAEQISFMNTSVRFVGGPCLTTTVNHSVVAALDDVEMYGSLWNNCMDMFVGGTIFSPDYAGVYLFSASVTAEGNEISAIRNQDNINGPITGMALTGGNAHLLKTHFEGNTATQNGSRELFLDGEGGSVISATDCAGVHYGAKTCIYDNGDNETIEGVSNNTNAPYVYVNLVDVSGATNAHVSGISNKNCSNCAPSNAYVVFTSAQYNELGPDPAFSYKRTSSEQVNGVLGVNIKPTVANTLFQVDNGPAVAATNMIRLSGGNDFGRCIWQFTTDAVSNANDYMLLGCDGNNDALKIPNSNGMVQAKYLLGTLPVVSGSLSACNAASEGSIHSVTDATSTVLGTTYSGGGANHVDLYCNGTNWIINSGTAGILTGSVSGSTTALAANTCGDSVTATVNGAATSMGVIATGQGNLPTTGLVIQAAVTSSNTVTVQYCNITTGSITPGALTINLRVVP